MTLVRTISWSLIFTYLKNYGFIMLGIVCLVSIIIPMLKFKNDLGYQQIFLGAITALFGPCLVGNDFTPFYLIIGLINSLAMTMALIILTILVIFDHVIKSHPEAFLTETFDNQTSITDFTLGEIFIGQHPFFLSITCLLAMWIISLVALYFLHKCLDPVNKLKYSKRLFPCLKWISFSVIAIVGCLLIPIWFMVKGFAFVYVICTLRCKSDVDDDEFETYEKCFEKCFPPFKTIIKKILDTLTISAIWKPDEKLWFSKMEEYLLIGDNIEEFNKLDTHAKTTIGETIMEFAARTGKFHLLQVSS